MEVEVEVVRLGDPEFEGRQGPLTATRVMDRLQTQEGKKGKGKGIERKERIKITIRS